MPLYRISIEKYHPGSAEYWSNVYHTTADTVQIAGMVAENLCDAEQGLYGSGTFITKWRVDDMTPDTDIGHTEVKNLAGTNGLSGVLMPLWVVSRVDFSTIGGGRPSRKYLRATIQEEETTFMALAPALITRLSIYAAAAIGAGFTDIDQQAINSYAVWPTPAMRQLRRGSKKNSVL